MDRIERLLQGIENRVVYLASHEELTEAQRAWLLPVLESHLETVNRWKMARMRMEGEG